MTEEVKTPEPEKTVNESVPLDEAEGKTGIKDAGVNQDAVDGAKETKSDPKKEAALPSFFVEDDDTLRIEVDILFDKDDGKLVSVSRSGILSEEDFDMLGYCKEWFEFHPVGYEEMSNYRQRCSVYRGDVNRSLVDPVALRNYLIVWHLKDWSMRGRDGKKIELKFSESGALDDDSIKAVYKLNTTLLDVVLTLFEKDMMM